MNSEKKQINQPIIVSYYKLKTECSHWWRTVLQNHLSLKNILSSYLECYELLVLSSGFLGSFFQKIKPEDYLLKLSFLNSELSSAVIPITGKSRTREGRSEPVW